MKPGSLKDRTVSAMLWSFIERFGTLSIQFISNIVLARLLSPEEFGLIGMIMVFIALSQTIVDSGFDSALIQKKDATQTDYSTVFFFNIILGCILALILYGTAPFIATFYREPQLVQLLRVLGVILIVNSFCTIQRVILRKNLQFKNLTIIHVISATVSTVLSILTALSGFGVWSLVILNLVNSLTRSLILWFISKWRPMLMFDINSFLSLFAFGYKLLIASLLRSLNENLKRLIIGRTFTSIDLGYFTQASKLEQIPARTLTSVFTQVSFPVFASLQDEKTKMVYGIRKSLKTMVYINFPVMVLVFILAEPLIIFLYGRVWLQAVPYLKILALAGMLHSIHGTNVTLLKANGKGNLYLILAIVKNITSLLLMLFFIRYGVMGVVIGAALSSHIILFVNGFFSFKVVGYGIRQQFKDVLPMYFLSWFVGGLVFSIFQFFPSQYFLKIIITIILYFSTYLLLSKLLKFEAYNEFEEIIYKRFKK